MTETNISRASIDLEPVRIGSENLKEKFPSFVKGLEKTDRIGLLFDSDPDGFCSALIACKAIERLAGVRPTFRMPCQYGMDFFGENMRQAFQQNKLNKVLVFDLNLDQDRSTIQNLPLVERHLDKIVFFDHHPLGKSLHSEKTIVVKSQYVSSMEPSKYCTSKLTFDQFSQFADLSDLDWIASIGIIADVGYRQWKDFVDNALNRFQLDSGNSPEAFDSGLGKLVDLIMDTFTVEPKNSLKLFEQFYAAKKPSELFQSEFMEYRALIEAETNFWLKQFGEKAERFPEKSLAIFEIRPKFKIKSEIATKLSFQVQENLTVIVCQNMRSGIVSFSARRRDGKKDLNHLLQQAVQGTPNSSAGGHKFASAGQVPEKDWPTVKNRLIELF